MVSGFISRAAVAAGLLTLVGCASSPLSPKGDAIYDALQADTRMRTWADSCSEVSARAEKAADVARTAWWRRNGNLVESADYGLAWDMVTVTDKRQHTGARVAMALTWGVVETAEAEVNAALASTSNRESVCLSELDRYKAGDYDLSDRETTYQQLLELQHFKDMKGDALMLRKASIERQTGKEYGRSFYVVEKLAKRYACPGADVTLLRNNWPEEVYMASCDSNQSLLLRCDWGNCRIIE